MRVVVIIAVVTVCMPCFGLLLDCGQMLSAWGGLCPPTSLISCVALYCLYCLCFVNCTKFGNAILTKNCKNCCHQISDFTVKMQQIRLRLGLRRRPSWGASSAPPDPLPRGEETGCPLLKNFIPALGPSGLDIRPFGPRYFDPSVITIPRI